MRVRESVGRHNPIQIPSAMPETAPRPSDSPRVGRLPLAVGGSADQQEPVGNVAAAAERTRPRWWRDQLRRRMLAAADLVAALAMGLAIAVPSDESLAWALVAVAIGLPAAKLLGLYDLDHRSIRHLTVDEIPTLAAWVGVTLVGSMTLAPGLTLGGRFLLVLLGALLLATGLRGLARALWRRFTPPESTVVVGVGAAADAIRRKVQLFDDMHLELLEDLTPQMVQAPNGADPLDGVIGRVDRVVIAWAEADPLLVERLLELCRRHETKLSVVSPFRGRARPAERVSSIADVPVLEYNTWDVSRSTVVLKRAFDVLAAGIGLLALSPLFLLIGAAIKLDDGGAVFFRQRRAGKGGVPFRMLKFRSMVVGAEDRLPVLVALEQLKDPMFKLKGDPRVTRVGRFLRRFSLDELPQLWNVLKGEMSLVGPRPEELTLVERYRPEHTFRLAVKPGVTGPMQVFGRGELSFEERLAVDIDYVENVSLARDFKVLAATVPSIVRGTGAF